MKIFCIFLFTVIAIMLLTYALGKLKKHVRIHLSFKSPLTSTEIEIEANDKK